MKSQFRLTGNSKEENEYIQHGYNREGFSEKVWACD